MDGIRRSAPRTNAHGSALPSDDGPLQAPATTSPPRTGFEDLRKAPERPRAEPAAKALTHSERARQLQSSLDTWIRQGKPGERQRTADLIRASLIDGAPLDFARMNLGPGTGLPEAFGLLAKLKFLNLGDNALTEAEIPASFGDLSRLQDLHIHNNKLTCIPPALSRLSGLETLDIRCNALRELAGIEQWCELQQLIASGNQLTKLPEGLGRIKPLRVLHLGGNRLTSLPADIGMALNLRLVEAADNRISRLPESIYAHDPRLLRLGLQGNPLSVGTLYRLQEWYPPGGDDRHAMLDRLATTLALPEGAPELADLGSLADMRLGPPDTDTRYRLENRFLQGDPRRAVVHLRLATLTSSSTAASLKSSAREALGDTGRRIELASDPTMVGYRHALLEDLSSYELLHGQCRAATRIMARGPAAAGLEQLTRMTLGRLGAGALDAFAPEVWQAYFGARHTDAFAQQGHHATAWLREHAGLADNPRFGAKGYRFDSAGVRGRFMKELGKLLDELDKCKKVLERGAFDLGFERDLSLRQRLSDRLGLGPERARRQAHEREPAPTTLDGRDVRSVKLRSQRPVAGE